MFLHADGDVEVARRTAWLPDLALAAERLRGKNRVVTDVGTEINEGSVDGQ